jgi:hypothetical protein
MLVGSLRRPAPRGSGRGVEIAPECRCLGRPDAQAHESRTVTFAQKPRGGRCRPCRRGCGTLSGSARNGINFRKFKASREKFPQALLGFRDELQIAPIHGDVASSHFRKVFPRERQPRNAAHIEVKRSLLSQFDCLCSINEEVLARASCPLIVRLGRGVEHNCKGYSALAAGCSTQHNVGPRPWPDRFTKWKVAEDVIASTKHQPR